MIRALSSVFVRYTQRLMPDPYILVLLLTAIVMVLDFIFVQGMNFNGLLNSWFNGVWGGGIFTFTLEMILVLVTGYTLAEAPLLKKGLGWLAEKPKNQVQAAILVFFVGAVASLLNWGFGLVIGALLSKQIVKRLKVHFGFLIAVSYMAWINWSSGFSSSIALVDTSKDPVVNIIYKMTHQIAPLSQTIFQPYNWIPVLVVLIVFPFMIKFITPKGTTEVDLKALEDPEPQETPQQKTIATRLENTPIINILIFLIGLYIFIFIMHGKINLNSVIMLFTILGVILHGTPIKFVRAFSNAAKTTGPLILQYPFYGGLMAIMTFAPDHHQSLAVILATALVHGSSAWTLPFMNFIGSLIISLFVPSGGGHWTVQGPIAIQAATHFSTSSAYLGKVSMSVALGEQVANMIQPFWLLPLLAIARLSIRDVMGYCVMAFIAGVIIFGAAILFIPAM